MCLYMGTIYCYTVFYCAQIKFMIWWMTEWCYPFWNWWYPNIQSKLQNIPNYSCTDYLVYSLFMHLQQYTRTQNSKASHIKLCATCPQGQAHETEHKHMPTIASSKARIPTFAKLNLNDITVHKYLTQQNS